MRWWPHTRGSIRDLPELVRVPEPERRRAFADAAGRVTGWYHDRHFWTVMAVFMVAEWLVAHRTNLLPAQREFPALLLFCCPIAFVWRVARDRAAIRELRRENKFCVRCGYDCRATPDRCPECGTVPDEAKPNAKAPSRQGAPREDEDAGS